MTINHHCHEIHFINNNIGVWVMEEGLTTTAPEASPPSLLRDYYFFNKVYFLCWLFWVLEIIGITTWLSHLSQNMGGARKGRRRSHGSTSLTNSTTNTILMRDFYSKNLSHTYQQCWNIKETKTFSLQFSLMLGAQERVNCWSLKMEAAL